MKNLPALALVVVTFVFTPPLILGQEKASPPDQSESMRSYPPDTTPYSRENVPEDVKPGGKPAIPPGHLIGTPGHLIPPKPPAAPPGKEPENGSETPDSGIETLSGTDALVGADAAQPAILIVDTVVSNTNANLTNTEQANDGETSIAINPANPNEIVVSAFSGPLARAGALPARMAAWELPAAALAVRARPRPAAPARGTGNRRCCPREAAASRA